MITPFTYPSPAFTETSSLPLDQLPNEIFNEIILEFCTGNILLIQPDELIIKLFLLSDVSASFKNKVDEFCLYYLQRIGKIAKLATEFPEINFSYSNPKSLAKSRIFLIERGRNWKNCTPKVTEFKILVYINTINCLVNNPKGHLELWTLDKAKDTLKCTDLKTQEVSKVKLPYNVAPAIFQIGDKGFAELKLAILNGNKIALCCTDSDQGHYISVIEKDEKGLCVLCHKTENIYAPIELHVKDKYLYVSCHDKDGIAQLVQYNSENWNEFPKALLIPYASKFHFTKHGLLCCFNKYQMKFFENIHDSFPISMSEFIGNFKDFKDPLKIIDNKILAWEIECSAWNNPSAPLETTCQKILARECEAMRNSPSSSLVRLGFENSILQKTHTQKFPLFRWGIWTFEVLFDKVIVFQTTLKNILGCEFYDLKTGKLLTEFDAPMETDFSVPFYALKVLPDKTIQLVYQSAANLPHLRDIWVKTFDFNICEADNL